MAPVFSNHKLFGTVVSIKKVRFYYFRFLCLVPRNVKDCIKHNIEFTVIYMNVDLQGTYITLGPYNIFEVLFLKSYRDLWKVVA